MGKKIRDDEEKQIAFDGMKKHFLGREGYGMDLDDSTFLRYLRARNFNFDKAKKMLEDTLTWRDTFGLADLYKGGWSDVIAKENETGKLYVRGYTREGHALVYMKPRYENTSNHDGNLKHLVYNIERAISSMKKRGPIEPSKEKKSGDACSETSSSIWSFDSSGTPPLASRMPDYQEKLAIMIDYEGFSVFNSPPMKTSKETLSILQNHYPERLFRAYLVRPPFIFHGFWSVISPFIDPVTKAKICFVKSDPKQFLEQTKHELDHSVLETCIGGSDSREFDSKVYLDGSFDKDYLSLLDSS